MESGKLFLKRNLILLTFLCLSTSVFAFEYQPRNVDVNPFGNKKEKVQKSEHATKPEMREIKTLTEYFRYLPAEVHRHWTPYKANAGYEVTVKFRVQRDGNIADLKIVDSTNDNANESVLNAVKSGAPYQPLPASYPNKDGVVAQVILEYQK
jgi:TonB family protein